jgi:hypothetical protein
MIPKSKPQAARELVISAAYSQWRKFRPFDPLPETFLVGVRSYYFRTMGDPAKGDRNIYDDAVFVVSDNVFASYNANTDPSPFRSGVATLLPGVYPFKLGNHGISRPGGGYPAFRPATKDEALPVKRDGEALVPSKRPGIAINIHKGGYGTTSSLGCQTLYPTQWDSFYNLAKGEMVRSNIKRIEYILIDGPIN